MSCGKIVRRNFRQLERLVRTHAVEYLIDEYKQKKHYTKKSIKPLRTQPIVSVASTKQVVV
jgi:hypothetical protein